MTKFEFPFSKFGLKGIREGGNDVENLGTNYRLVYWAENAANSFAPIYIPWGHHFVQNALSFPFLPQIPPKLLFSPPPLRLFKF